MKSTAVITEKQLLVIIPDRLSALIQKGEITARYYNPGNLFDEVHILMINDDRPDPADLQKTVGNARLVLHNLPEPLYLPILGYHPWHLNRWARCAVKLAREIRPAMIRCHGSWLNSYPAYRIKRALGIPYAVSLHINPDEDVRGRLSNRAETARWAQLRNIERIMLRNADIVLPVYQPIVPYLKSQGVSAYEVAYNALNPDHLRKKTEYALHDPVRLLSVGRHFREKHPSNIIRALMHIPQAHLTLVGDGPAQTELERLAVECGVAGRTSFLRTVPNDRLCAMLPDFDIFVVHTEYWEIGKSVLEPLLTGLPVVINRRKGEPVPELQGDHVVLVDNTPEGYRAALEQLIRDDARREALGRRAYAHAQTLWAPAKTEAKFVEIYKRILNAQGI